MNGERSRLVLTLAVAIGLGFCIILVRRTRSQRARHAFAPRDGDIPFVTLKSLDEARTMDHTAVVMQGGRGAQVYLTVPVKYVTCNQAALVTLLRALGERAGNDSAGAALSFELAPIGSGIAGAMGGGSVVDGIWLHPSLAETGAAALAERIIYGDADREEAAAIDTR